MRCPSSMSCTAINVDEFGVRRLHMVLLHASNRSARFASTAVIVDR